MSGKHVEKHDAGRDATLKAQFTLSPPAYQSDVTSLKVTIHATASHSLKNRLSPKPTYSHIHLQRECVGKRAYKCVNEITERYSFFIVSQY